MCAKAARTGSPESVNCVETTEIILWWGCLTKQRIEPVALTGSREGAPPYSASPDQQQLLPPLNSLRASFDIQLHKQTLRMCLHCVHRNKQLVCDLLVG